MISDVEKKNPNNMLESTSLTSDKPAVINDARITNKPSVFKVSKLDGEEKIVGNSIILSKHHQQDDVLAQIHYIETSSRKEKSVVYDIIFKETADINQAQMSPIIRKQISLSPGSCINLQIINEPNPVSISEIVIEIKNVDLYQKKPCVKLKKVTLVELFKSRFANYPLSTGQQLYMENRGNLFILDIKKISHAPMDIADNICSFRVQKDSEVDFILSPESADKCSFISPTGLPKFCLDFKSQGIGGHKEQLTKLLRDCFYTRAMDKEYVKAYDVKHTKGILLYGPPGTGKTLIARTIGGFFTQDHIKVINGSELKNCYVGQSQANLREVFAPAEEAWKQDGENSELYVVIIDEIDALCPKRGAKDISGNSVDDDMVTQLLTIMDGVNSPGNIIVIGMTNRKELIDPAILRPGRLAVHIEIGLPDQQGRLEILNIKTEKMRNNGLLDEDVNLSDWAEQTENYTGAEIEQLVKDAAQRAMNGNFDKSAAATQLSMRKDIKSVSQLSKIKPEHFAQAFEQNVPAFGFDKKIRAFKKKPFTAYNLHVEEIIQNFQASCATMSSSNNRLQFLIDGESGVGKTNLAFYLAELSGAKYIKTLSAETLISLSPENQIQWIDSEFANAERTEFSVLILDDFENLLGANAECSACNNMLRIKFIEKLKSVPSSDKKCIIIATTSDRAFLARMKLANLFQESESLQSVHLDCLSSADSFEVLEKICTAIGYQIKKSAHNQPTDDTREINVPIRELIYQIEKFCTATGVTVLDIDCFYDRCFGSQNVEDGSLSYHRKKSPLINSSFLKPLIHSNNESRSAESQLTIGK